MNRRRRRKMKRAAMIVIPIVLLCIASFAIFTSLSKASETAFSYQIFKDDEYSDSSNEYDNTNQNEDLEMDEDLTLSADDFDKTSPDSITVLVNKELPIQEDYIPKDLVVPNVEFQIPYYDEKKQMRAEAATALEKLFEAAKSDGLFLCGVSGFRSYQRQYKIFTTNIKNKSLEHAMQYSAIPGRSEHQTGLAIDVSTSSVSYRIDSSFAETPESQWLVKNAHLYGYIIRYPEDKTQITGYSYEPWHIRYVGKALATYIYRNNLTLEEFYGFEPTMDYFKQISLESLTQYGIDLNDVIQQTTVAPVIETEAIVEETEETNPSEESVTETSTESGEEILTDTDIIEDETEPSKGTNNTGTKSSGTKTETKNSSETKPTEGSTDQESETASTEETVQDSLTTGTTNDVTTETINNNN